MDRALLAELFRCARNYHGALADYAAAMRMNGDVESTAQLVVGTSLRYRRAIDRLLESEDSELLRISRGRLERLRRTLVSTSRSYNLAMKHSSARQAEAPL